MSFRTEIRHNCTIVFGSLPIMDYVKLTQEAPEGAVMHLHLQKMLGASMVIGQPGDLKVLSQDPHVRECATAIARREIGDHKVSDSALEWLVSGERGASSDYLFSVTTGVPIAENRFPADPADFARCRKLYEAVPEVAQHLGKAGTDCPRWQGLVDRWAQLCELMDIESPGWRESKGSAPKTYAILQSL